MIRSSKDGLALKLKQIKANLNKMQRKGEEKKQLLVDLENGIAKAMHHIDDHRSLKTSLCSLSEQFLHGPSKRKSSSTRTNAEKLLAMDRKISTMRDAMERKKKTHANEMQRLLREHGVLDKVRFSHMNESAMSCNPFILSIDIIL